MATVRMCPVLPMLFLWILVRDSGAHRYVDSGLDFAASFGSISSSVTCPANASRIFYGIMFDAGSTGTRIHVYTFIQKDREGLPILDNEMFDSVKPGLSAYADMPEYAGHMVRQLLKIAKNTVPRVVWKQTPLVLKATAGLRLLPPAKAHALLEEVQNVFDESPFYVPADSVSILSGTNEGILAWVTLNFLTGHLYPKTKKTVGILDLGGGSTQITFLPKSKKTIERVPADYIARFDVFNTTYELYTHSSLGHGIKAARLAAMGALTSEGLERKAFKTFCLPKQYKGEFSFGGFTYKVNGISDGNTGYKICYQEMLKVVKGIIQQPYELKDSSVFYAFSYYFDHAVEANLIDEAQGGTLQVLDFKKKAKEVCNRMSLYNPDFPFLCMDLAYITCLLKDGYGFQENAALELTKKVNNVEASWALGAAISYLEHITQNTYFPL
ncbi:ectonucleoside triphosphate diphosphohydrolase 5 isoform X1 [Electrophorus electricus]|uniref:ectonucleoside triphosphate diphosphohydrolase 5 isoform X1 n=2 Tax=Electrophorus electricus TaxID=8005 RepID=UPI0015D02706|nr:ectonucleoside triphosphate diphosphohydrolase 5 isoform X1 [Electrophorus electricus]XP_026886977.2 ectonucleoside triphosphate diphosphohydrolase 5 isoform X1 [Electrophorus electricus]